MALKVTTERAINWFTELKKEQYIRWVKDHTERNKLDDQSSAQTGYTGVRNINIMLKKIQF